MTFGEGRKCHANDTIKGQSTWPCLAGYGNEALLARGESCDRDGIEVILALDGA